MKNARVEFSYFGVRTVSGKFVYTHSRWERILCWINPARDYFTKRKYELVSIMEQDGIDPVIKAKGRGGKLIEKELRNIFVEMWIG